MPSLRLVEPPAAFIHRVSDKISIIEIQKYLLAKILKSLKNVDLTFSKFIT